MCDVREEYAVASRVKFEVRVSDKETSLSVVI